MVAVEAGPAAALLESGALHAYIGADPFRGHPLPAGLGAVESLGSYLVATFDRTGPFAAPAERCAAARRLAHRLSQKPGGWVFHPYPITPFDADYLQHIDRARAARAAALAAPAAGPPLRVRASGALAVRLAGRSAGGGPGPAVSLEEIGVQTLLGPARASLGGLTAPPWFKAGWFRAYRLLEPGLGDGADRRRAEAIYRRLVTGDYLGRGGELDLERDLIARLTGGCERVVVGYTARREVYNADYSAGVENVGFDSLDGLASSIFVRTVKLKDFPWNGWLRLGAPPPGSAWNPVAGFTDVAGRVIWAALGDPALLPAPYGEGWVPNRVTPALAAGPGSIAVPADAQLPQAGTGTLQPVGPGQRAAVMLLERALLGTAHDGSRMSVADLLYSYAFAFRWGDGTDAALAQATALARQWLAGVRVARVETVVRTFGEDLQYTYDVPVVEVYLRRAVADPAALASVAPAWSAVPWHVMALLDEAVRRGLGAFSAVEAERRGVGWLDPVRAEGLKAELRALVDEFERTGWVPAALVGVVSPSEARERWAKLRAFAARYGHYLPTAGPYRLAGWSPVAATLEVFRDRTYPLGVGEFDRYPIPRRAYASRIEDRGDRLEVEAQVEVLSKFQRTWEIVREPLARAAAEAERFDRPVCRYVILDTAGRVAAAGTAAPRGPGGFAIDLARLAPGRYEIAVALYVGDNAVAPAIAVVRHRQGA